MKAVTNRSRLRAIPSVDRILRELAATDIPRPAVVALVRRELKKLRAHSASSNEQTALDRVRAAVDCLRKSKLQPIINGTGIIIHTNFGRSPLGEAVINDLVTIAANYNNLEYDLISGERGGRAAYVEHNLAVLCQAESATVVNNCAAALVLILRHFATSQRPQVIISRGELVQIGGGFRIPEILAASGATLREVGTTNKTTLADYARVISKQTAMLLRVHRSNFAMDGFVASPQTSELAGLAKKHRLPLVADLGSGTMFPTEQLGGTEHEPTPSETLRAGADLVCFSGDKLLGGPQAGIIAGKARFIAALKREPFFRALRCDKLILCALQSTVDLHLDGAGAGTSTSRDRQGAVPIFAMMQLSNEELSTRAQRIIAALNIPALIVTMGQGRAQIGGGSLPRTIIPSITIDLPAELAARLRNAQPPVIGYISAGRLKLDLRTIFPRQDDQVVAAICQAIGH